jgi:phage-related protein
MKIRVDNFSSWEDYHIRKVVSWVAKDLKLRRDIHFIFQSTWTEIDDYGNIVPDTEAEVGFDGDAYDNGVVRVCIGKSLEFPFAYDINDELDGFYLRHIVELKDGHEMLLHMTAHELRHLWQWEHPEKARQIRRLLHCDDETDADIYAMMTLSRYRNR